MKKAELIFIPAPFMGHMVSIVGLAKILAERYEQLLLVTVLILKLPSDEKVVSYSKQLAADSSSSGIRYVDLVTPEEPSPSSESKSSLIFEFIDLHKNQVRDILSERSDNVAAVILDMFCTSMIDVANEFEVPSYVFFASGAAVLGFTLHVQRLRDDFSEDVASYLDKDINLSIPTYFNPVPAKLSPGLLFVKEQDGSNAFLDQAKRYRLVKGIIINTFLELESHAVQALSEDKTIPPVYTAGPIVLNHLKGSSKSSTVQNEEDDLKIMKWLDLQPNKSVVFLCFGSFGSFSKEQVMEIAYALERSGYRFLWSLRKPPEAESEQSLGSFPSEYETLHEVLSEGFLKGTINGDESIGKVIGWAPQMQVLSHPAVGGFVSHCGWNSILESMWCGVPIAAFPIYAEQQANAFLMVKELGLAVEIKIDHRKDFCGSSKEGIVKAEEIENGIRQLMNQENGTMRNKVKEMKEKCRLALMEGGSSSASLRCFIDDVLSSKK